MSDDVTDDGDAIDVEDADLEEIFDDLEDEPTPVRDLVAALRTIELRDTEIRRLTAENELLKFINDDQDTAKRRLEVENGELRNEVSKLTTACRAARARADVLDAVLESAARQSAQVSYWAAKLKATLAGRGQR